MKATMVEFLNEYGQWCWYKVTTKTPEEALKEYLYDNSIEGEITGGGSDDLIIEDEVRAYAITIEN